MKFSLQFTAELNASGGKTVSEFSERMARKLRDRARSSELQDAKFVEMQKIKREAGPGLWAAVKSDLAFEVKSLNVEMGKDIVVIEVTPSSEISLRADLEGSHRRFRAEYSAELGQLTWNRNGSIETFEVYMQTGQRPSFYGGMIPYGSRSLAQQMLEILLG